MHLLRIIIFFLLFNIYCNGQQDLDKAKNEINLENNDPGVVNETTNQTQKNWELITINNETVLRSLTKFELDLKCEAPFPIEWNITGHIQDPDFVMIQPYKRDILGEENGSIQFLFKIQILIFFDPDASVTLASSRIFCQRVGKPEINKSYAIFLRGVRPLVNGGQVLNLLDTKVIPCPTTDPTLKLDLIQNGRQVSSTNYKYDPLVGFVFQNVVQGRFACVTAAPEQNDTVLVFANISQPSVTGFNYFPKTKLVKSFTDEEIELKCSKTGEGSNKLDILVNSSLNITLTKKIEIDLLTNFTVVIAKIKSLEKGNGTATCVDNSLRGFWTWNLEFVEPPGLYLGNYEGEVDCISDYEDRTVSTLRCREPSHCEFMKNNCFSNPNLCNYLKQKQFYSNETKLCYNYKDGQGFSCASVPYSHLNGIIQCGARGLVKHFLFFVSLEFLRRSNWEQLEPSELIQMDDVNPILYTNKTSRFFCRAVAFLFADDLKFSIEFQNKTRTFLNNSEIIGDTSERKVEEFNVLAELNILLPIDAVSIHCHAPWFNSSDFYHTERRFETRHLLHPEIFKIGDDEPQIHFVIGKDNTQRLNCSSIGEPQPIYEWFKDGNPIENSSVSHQTQITTGSNGESLLEFLQVQEESAGEYLCLAGNIVGNDSQTFKVNTKEPEQRSASSSKTYGTIIGSILFLMICLIVVLAYVVNRYMKAQKLIRGLTENEIEEFFNGRPELVNSNQGITAEHLDLMPYDKEYELDLDDLEFDSTKVLGSGEFSVVLKGHLKSRGLNVAVKIAKPAADVSLFKTMLSEVKIMIFIKKHEHIVSLLGVSTKNIRTRNIHIVLEICENGSLEKYLRKERKNFISLVDMNQKLNLQLLKSRPDSEYRLNTLDLIKWAAQIAKGMEYLSFRGIVHADLAARNVLLSKNNVAKISDFGLSRKLYECTNYVKKSKSPLPWRWMAIESLNTLTFSKESDVWSYGVTIWEIFTLGDTPFPNETWDKEFINRISTGLRMGKPKYANLEIYSQMVNCWDSDSLYRPEFSTMRKFFSDLMEGVPYLHDPMGSGTNLTFFSDTVSNTDDLYTGETPSNMYGNVNPEGGPMYTNMAIEGMPMYSNVP